MAKSNLRRVKARLRVTKQVWAQIRSLRTTGQTRQEWPPNNEVIDFWEIESNVICHQNKQVGKCCYRWSTSSSIDRRCLGTLSEWVDFSVSRFGVQKGAFFHTSKEEGRHYGIMTRRVQLLKGTVFLKVGTATITESLVWCSSGRS